MDRLISEQDVLDVINEAIRIGRFYCGKEQTIKEIKAIPSAEPKTEHWIITYPHGKQNPIYECPRCHASNSSTFKNFCPNCGVRLNEPQERSE